MDLNMLLAYLAASTVIVAVPGPNILLIINDSVRYGFRRSVATIMGIKAGILLLFLISLSGLTALLTLYSSLFTLIKWVGAGYLVYLGISQIVASGRAGSTGQTPAVEMNNFFLKGFLVSVTNPKGMLFAGAFFPQFIDKQMAIAPQIAILCGGFVILSTLIEIVYAVTGDRAAVIFKTEGFKRLTGRISGAFLILFGIGLCFMKERV